MVQCPNCGKATHFAPEVCECGHDFAAYTTGKTKSGLSRRATILIALGAIFVIAAGVEYFREETAASELERLVSSNAAFVDEMPGACRNTVEDLKFRVITASLPLEKKRMNALLDRVYAIQERYCPRR